ncbi:MAG: FHA domain-containing protein [Actinomycetota bacterium]|nr:FHA domain-containing protein [Actinomycetota bacterium]
MQELPLFLVRIGVLVLLWLFVLAALRVIRTDLFGPRTARPRPAARPAPARPARESRRSTPRKLIVTAGALAGTSVALGDAPVTIGRSDDSTLVLTDDYASSKHARLVPGNGQWLVEDMGSTNGTYLDRAKVVRPTPVPLGVPIRIGKTVLELRR